MSQVAMCPHCGANFQLTHEYVAQYGGQQTQCGNCKNPFPIPRALAAPMAWSGAPAATVLGYMGSAISQTAQGVWSEGNLVLAANGAVLPARCVKCNDPADGPPSRKTFLWHEPWVYCLALAPVVYIGVAMCVRKSGTVGVCLCHRHRVRRRWYITMTLLSIPLSIGIWILAANFDLMGLIPVGIVVLFVGLIWGAIGARLLAPKRIDDRFLWLKGAGPAFLASLPPSR